MFGSTNEIQTARRRGVTPLLIFWLALALTAAAAPAQPSAGQPPIVAVDAIGMTVSDMDRAYAWPATRTVT